MVISLENVHRGLIDILIIQSLNYGAIDVETLHHSPTLKPSVTQWPHLISHLRGLCRQVLCKPTCVCCTLGRLHDGSTGAVGKLRWGVLAVLASSSCR